MRLLKTLAAFLAAIIMVAGSYTQGLAVPPLPSSFYGTVTINGSNAPPGTEVSAWINGVKYAYTSVVEYNGSAVYSLDVPGDDTSTPVIEGGIPGDTIEFRIGAMTAQETGIWQSGTNVQVNLSTTTHLWMIFLPMILK